MICRRQLYLKEKAKYTLVGRRVLFFTNDYTNKLCIATVIFENPLITDSTVETSISSYTPSPHKANGEKNHKGNNPKIQIIHFGQSNC